MMPNYISSVENFHPAGIQLPIIYGTTTQQLEKQKRHLKKRIPNLLSLPHQLRTFHFHSHNIKKNFVFKTQLCMNIPIKTIFSDKITSIGFILSMLLLLLGVLLVI